MLDGKLRSGESNEINPFLSPHAKCFVILNPYAKCFVPLNPYAKCFVPLSPYAKCFMPKNLEQHSTHFHPILGIIFFPTSHNKGGCVKNATTKRLLPLTTQKKPLYANYTINSFHDYFHSLSFIVCVLTFCLFYSLFNTKTCISDDVEKSECPHIILKNLRMKNTNKIIIGHLNINSIRNKIFMLADIVRNNIDILLISETKIDNSFPKSQFLLHGFSEPYRLD